jgi:hypothetical protein
MEAITTFLTIAGDGMGLADIPVLLDGVIRVRVQPSRRRTISMNTAAPAGAVSSSKSNSG